MERVKTSSISTKPTNFFFSSSSSRFLRSDSAASLRISCAPHTATHTQTAQSQARHAEPPCNILSHTSSFFCKAAFWSLSSASTSFRSCSRRISFYTFSCNNTTPPKSYPSDLPFPAWHSTTPNPFESLSPPLTHAVALLCRAVLCCAVLRCALLLRCSLTASLGVLTAIGAGALALFKLLPALGWVESEGVGAGAGAGLVWGLDLAAAAAAASAARLASAAASALASSKALRRAAASASSFAFCLAAAASANRSSSALRLAAAAASSALRLAAAAASSALRLAAASSAAFFSANLLPGGGLANRASIVAVF